MLTDSVHWNSDRACLFYTISGPSAGKIRMAVRSGGKDKQSVTTFRIWPENLGGWWCHLVK